MHYGLALSGGGTRGAAHVGVLKALEEARLLPDAVAGTSCRLPRYLTKPRQRRSEWDMAGSDGISRVSAVFRGKSLLTNKMRII